MSKKNKVKNLKSEKELLNQKLRSKRLSSVLLVSLFVFILLVLRLFCLQFVQGSSLKEQAYKQQIANKIISPKRGTIYDTNGKALAISAQVDTVSVNPGKVKYKNKKLVENEKLATIFSTIFELDYESVLEKVSSDRSVVTIAEKVEKDKIDLLKKALEENEITAGVNIDEDTKRYYPYDNLASNLIGFFGTDAGLEGIEARWDSVLTGTSGKKVALTDSNSREIPNKEQTYYAAQNGSNIKLTIDVNIQTIVEKYLKQAVTENSCKRGGNVIVMQPSTGDILAMATYPDYNLNSPFEVDSSIWRNKAVSNTYEPGSTFKLINAAIGLEEGLVDTDTQVFNCKGFEQFNGVTIHCWKLSAHGTLSLRGALQNSCNPAFMQLGQKIGTRTLYKYYEAFGLFNPTGIALYGEANSLFHNMDSVGDIELATMSFGQRFTITPLQLITAVSSLANDGILMQPRIVKEIENTDTGAVTTIEPTAVRQVISKETSLKMLDMMESVVSDGTGLYGAVKGYSIGGKTGTSEPDPAKPEEGRTASYIAVAPVSNPEIVILVTLYQPTAGSTQGGSTAGPVVSQILSEVLPYLGVASNNTSTTTSTSYSSATLIDVRNKTVAEAKKQLKSYGFNVNYINNGENESEVLVTDQVPKPGVKLLGGSTICLYSENSNTHASVTVPNLKGKTLSAAKNILDAKKLNITFDR